MSRSGEPAAPAEVILVRHGQAHSNVLGLVAGPACTGLTDQGRAGAEALATRLTGLAPIDALHSSPTRRARETADILAGALGLPVLEQPRLRVPDPGAADGRPRAAARCAAGHDPAAESWSHYLGRATQCLRQLLAATTGRVVVVGHTETAIAAFALLLGTADLGALQVSLDHAAMTILRRSSGETAAGPRWRLVAHNDAAHLEPSMRRYAVAPR